MKEPATTSTDTKRAVIYLRVSSASQADKDFDAEGFSIPGQREACVREADKLGAEVVDEYIDRGESARTAKRPALRAMLDRLTRGGIDYVIVHKVDRLARNRADDIEIVMAIRQAGAQLVSATESIDETPSGLLLHGIMSSIAEFYSRNLAAEVIKGSTQKAKKGGTPYKAPIGYQNTREMVDGREVRTVILDPQRAPLVREAFLLYASGDYSLSELAAILEDRGLRSRPSRKAPAQAVGSNRLASMLRNPYYTGVVNYGGKTYEGRHEPLVGEQTFQEVQDLLDAKRVSGERSWRHFHYLRGSLYCRECGGRLFYTQVKGNGGLYDYFICSGRQERRCSQTYHRMEAVEAAVERHYAKVELSEAERQSIREAVKAHVAVIAELAAQKIADAEAVLTRLDQEERKLLNAHYADSVSESLFANEQARISRERVGATKTIEQLSFKHEQVLEALDDALALTDEIQRAYIQAGPQERRLLNQAFFERLEIDAEDVSADVKAEPFADLAHLGWSRDETCKGAAGISEGAVKAPCKAKTPDPISGAEGSNVEVLVPGAGLEPASPRGGSAF
jgi:site-specific DNA recombinase